MMMLLMYTFSTLTTAKSGFVTAAGIVLLYAVLIFFCAFLAMTITAVADKRPKFWAEFLGMEAKRYKITAKYTYSHGGSREDEIKPGDHKDFYIGPHTGNRYQFDKATCEMDQDARLTAVNHDSAVPEVRGDAVSSGCSVAQNSKNHIVECCFR